MTKSVAAQSRTDWEKNQTCHKRDESPPFVSERPVRELRSQSHIHRRSGHGEGSSATKVQFGLVQGIFCQTQTELRVQFSQNAEPNLEVWSQVVWFGFQTLNSCHI